MAFGQFGRVRSWLREFLGAKSSAWHTSTWVRRVSSPQTERVVQWNLDAAGHLSTSCSAFRHRLLTALIAITLAGTALSSDPSHYLSRIVLYSTAVMQPKSVP